MTSAADGLCTLDDRELVLHFESIGDNCELGLLQRRVGAERLGLLRFAGAPLRSVIRALENRFQGIADPLAVRLHEENNEFMVKLNRYDVYYHTHLKPGEITPAALHEQQCRTVTFLTNKLIADLEQPSKILVFRQNESVLASDLLDLRIALSAYGPSTLLWVQEACSGHPPGSIAVSDARLIIGYVNKLAPREDVPQLHAPSWLSVLRKAYAVWLRPENERMAAGREAAAQVRRIDLSFGADGNAGPYLGAGWSGPEAGYQWAIGESSVLTIPSLGAADQYWLEM